MKRSQKVKLSLFREDPDNVSVATDEEIQRLAGKLKRVPLGLTAMRIAYVTDAPGGGRMVISGNKRLRCLKAAYGEDGEVPAEWFQDITEMSEAERHEFRINANISDGSFDAEKLLAQYDTGELAELMSADALAALLKGMAEDPDKYGDSFQLADGDKSEFGEMNFVVTEKQREEINFAVSLAVYCDGYDGKENTNSNGAALALIVRDWLALKVKEAPDITKARREFEKLREGLCEALKKSGRKASEVDELLGTHGMAGHYFGESQWMFPTREAFEKMRTIMPLDGMDYERCKATEKLYRRAEMLQKNTKGKGEK